MDKAIIRQWYDVFKDNHYPVEIRIIGRGKATYSGYFTDVETLIRAIEPYEDNNIFFTLNRLKDGVEEKNQKDKIVKNAATTTADHDILGREWCLIDIDVERPKDTNSTDEEVEMAKEVAKQVFTFLKEEGFYSPVSCMSGNGAHLLYKQAMTNEGEAGEKNRKTMEKFLKFLDMRFSTDKCKIDTSTFNAARICKLYGTYSRKGSELSKTRPQRLSYIAKVPNEVKATPNEFFEKIASMYPESETPQRYNNYRPDQQFDLDSFISQNGIAVSKISRFSGGTKYVLEHCPFNHQHGAPDAAVFKLDNGALGFHCLHNSCSQYSWRDFRLHFDPSAYSRSEYIAYREKVQSNTKLSQPLNTEIKETTEKGKIWLEMEDIRYMDLSQRPFIPTGYTQIDKAIGGLMMGDISVLSGISGSGKSSLLNNLILNAVEKGYKVAAWSGEMQDFRFQGWITQAAAGKNYVTPKEGYENLYYVKKDIAKKINSWLKGKLWLFNNAYGNKWEILFEQIKNIRKEQSITLFVLDNLMALSIDSYSGEKNDKQSKFINDIKEFAKQEDIHIIIVAHPRKDMGFLRKESISGSGDIINLADNLFIIHRVGHDFNKRATDFYDEETVAKYSIYSNVVEIAKNRSFGKQDVLVGLYFEIESRRLKNEIAEHINYGWNEDIIYFPVTPTTDYYSLNQTNEIEFDDLPEY